MTEQGTVPLQAASESDEQALLQRLRDGEDAAFGELFELHAAAVRRLARSLASDRSEAEDITAETFFRVLQALRRGAGPRDYVRAYLLTVARRVSWEWHGARRDVPVSDDELTFRAGAGADTNARTAEHSLITTAFTSLPERWRSVLWQTEVEGEQPSMVAPHFGLSANATAALARRARQGLRAAYLQAHLSVNRGPDSCRAVVEKLGGFTAGSVTGAEARRIKTHLIGCQSCRATHDELRDVCSSLRAHAGVVALLVPGAAGLYASGSSGALSGFAASVKGLLLGSKVKVGMAVASTAAAGAVGLVAGPAVFGTDVTHTIGLSGGGLPELALLPPAQVAPPGRHEPVQIPPQRIAEDRLHGKGFQPVRTGLGPNAELGVADMPSLPGAAGTARKELGGDVGGVVAQPPAERYPTPAETAPRNEEGTESGSNQTTSKRDDIPPQESLTPPEESLSPTTTPRDSVESPDPNTPESTTDPEGSTSPVTGTPDSSTEEPSSEPSKDEESPVKPTSHYPEPGVDHPTCP
ncbi:sigma-70 family RNA polymerase sigma factor [Amycolatopsis regifaucium]|uniref:RNA polymerase subunit sigma n=1 Tax=Amycolatopsis regifaucium TaxID=546365 RepID=A0A154MQ99_9PSEU|nr:sigma-70 family RNA polymerase sigma factor [Amycolatopsis regifaucium]KZB86456.1 RNA polymerase subunit sigma [Amycolatopsis regifaucium]OKA06353.1 RNA polymerase subunit sigma [Amycolatopsis regifaucium]SFJ30795.1 RNA polymerase sigma factor, sigma-70 family [Amycolatopsis regifaucium]